MRKKSDVRLLLCGVLPLVCLLVSCGRLGDSAVPSDSASAAQLLDCGADSAFEISGSGLGALAIGATVQEVKSSCTVMRDTVVMGIEGMPSRELTIQIPRIKPVIAEVVDDSVWRIRVSAAPPFTSDSLGVGNTVAELGRRGTPTVLLGEGKAFLTLVGHCGVSFGLDDAPLGRLAAVRTQSRMLAVLPESARVDQILITGCR